MMSKINYKTALRAVEKSASKHAPELLLVFAGLCFVTSITEAWKEGKKSKENVAERREELQLEEDEKLPMKEVIDATWKNYIPVVVPMTVGIMCLFGAHSVNSQRNAALAAAYKLTEESYIRYKDKVKETIGEKKAEQIDTEIAKDLVGNDPVSKAYIINTGNGTSLYKETLFGNYFWSDRNQIDKAINNINERMMTEMYITVAELYSELNIPAPDAAGLLAWDINKTGIIRQTYHYTEANDGTPCGVLGFYNLPGPAYNDTKW